MIKNMAIKGKKLSEEHKKKLSSIRLQKKAELGFLVSMETRKKLSDIAKKNGSGKWMKGRHLSEETKQKLSMITKGKPQPWNKGRKTSVGYKHTQESLKKMSDASKGRIAWNRGLKMSNEAKSRMSVSAIGKHNGKLNPNWKGGVNHINDTIRKSTEVKLWRKSCLERDNFTCQKTGQVGGGLVVHHINNFADFPELRTSIENGVTLSKESHVLFHKMYGKKNNTRKQLEEFFIN